LARVRPRPGFRLFLEETSASFLTSSENLSAPVANDARARPVVLAATVPKAAASFKPDPKADNATFSAALIASTVGSFEGLGPTRALLPRLELLRRRLLPGLGIHVDIDYLRILFKMKLGIWQHFALLTQILSTHFLEGGAQIHAYQQDQTQPLKLKSIQYDNAGDQKSKGSRLASPKTLI
jgi:hypothetical protein